MNDEVRVRVVHDGMGWIEKRIWLATAPSRKSFRRAALAAASLAPFQVNLLPMASVPFVSWLRLQTDLMALYLTTRFQFNSFRLSCNNIKFK